MSVLDSKIPDGPLKDKWTNHKNKIDLVNPANKRNIDIIGWHIMLSTCAMRYKRTQSPWTWI